jgi:hypothetical protein
MTQAIRTAESAYLAGYATGQRSRSVYPDFVDIPRLANIVRPQEKPAIPLMLFSNYGDGVADGYQDKPSKVQDNHLLKID